MRVALNLLYLIPGVVGGTETYARKLMAALAESGSDTEFVVITNAEGSELPIPAGSNWRRVRTGVQATSRVRRYAWEQFRLPELLRRERVDLVHSLGYVGPWRAGVPHVLTIPDVNYVGQSTMSRARRAVLRRFVEGAARSASKIVTISYFSKREIVRHVGIPESHIVVTYLAGRTQLPSVMASDTVASSYGIRSPYFAAFSSSSQHKNIPALLTAFASICDRVPHTLVLIGHTPVDGTIYGSIRALGIQDRVVATGFVPDADVLPLLQGAELLAFPSLYEGFGLPVLDAQAAGVPVACSRAGSLPEVAGDAAVLFDPTSVRSIADALETTLLHPETRRALVDAGYENLRRFSWQQCAAQTLDVYRSVMRTA